MLFKSHGCFCEEYISSNMSNLRVEGKVSNALQISDDSEISCTKQCYYSKECVSVKCFEVATKRW